MENTKLLSKIVPAGVKKHLSSISSENIIAYVAIFNVIFIALVLLVGSIITSDMVTVIGSSILALTLVLYIIVSGDKVRLWGVFPFIVTAILCYGVLVISPSSKYLVFLILTVPILAFAIIGLKKGQLFSLLYGLLILVTFYFPIDGNRLFVLDQLSKVIVITAYIVQHISVFMIFKIYDRSSTLLKDTRSEKLQESKQHEDLLVDLSYHIRMPLNNIMMASEILSNANLDDYHIEMVDTIQASTNNLVSVLNAMIKKTASVQQVDSKKEVVFSLSNVMNSTVKVFTAQLSDVSFNFTINSNLSRTYIGDPVKLRQVFLNIIECILKNKVTQSVNIEIIIDEISGDDEGTRILFEFRSNKPLLLPLKQNEILLSKSQEELINILDLTISKHVVNRNGGELNVTLTMDDAIIKFDYMLKSNSPQSLTPNFDANISDDKKATPTASSAMTDVDLSRVKVLLVEDNLINQKIILLSLKKMVSSIDIANNGKEALDKFGTSKYDIILMDVQMPIMNGYVTTKKIREIESSINTHTPIIAITANALLGDREECISFGMDDYISKPFQIEVLVQKMKVLLRNKQ